MAISVERQTDGFTFFPYPPNHEDGRTNNGGFDLVQHPEQLDSIKELDGLPDIKRLVGRLNEPAGHFMTLGFEAGPQNNGFFGFLEFALRDPILSKKAGVYQRLANGFSDWIAKDYPEWNEAIATCTKVDVQGFHYHGAFHGDRTAFWFGAPDQAHFAMMVELLGRFLLQTYVPEEPPG